GRGRERLPPVRVPPAAGLPRQLHQLIEREHPRPLGRVRLRGRAALRRGQPSSHLELQRGQLREQCCRLGEREARHALGLLEQLEERGRWGGGAVSHGPYCGEYPLMANTAERTIPPREVAGAGQATLKNALSR